MPENIQKINILRNKKKGASYWNADYNLQISVFFFLVIFIHKIAFPALFMPMEAFLYLFILFFAFFYVLKKTLNLSEKLNWKDFLIRIFILSFITRIIFLVLQNGITYIYVPDYLPFELDAIDTKHYHNVGLLIAERLKSGLNISARSIGVAPSDYGFPLYLGMVYYVFGDAVFIGKLLNCVVGSFTVILLTVSVKRILTDEYARIVAYIAAFIPSSSWISSMYLKETVMVFIIILFFYSATNLTHKKVNALNIGIAVLSVMALFFFRTFLGMLSITIFVTYFTITSQRSFVRRIITVLIGGAFFYIVILNSSLLLEVEQTQSSAESQTQVNFFRRTVAKNNYNFSFSQLPLIVSGAIIAPYPNFYDLDSDKHKASIRVVYRAANEMTRNILYFFGFLGMWLFRKRWKKLFFIYGFYWGYLVVIAITGTAVHYRFQYPVVPFMIIFMSIGIVELKNKPKYRKLFPIYLSLLFLAYLGYNILRINVRG
ncbi:hypothetical protein ACE01N_06015 [Saccharicrinis sp. FJH2]|uniref:hypothetical protein n=1 Tax=Saccharicrinis sp. FJH65 TaxID=3344659 RepID=UPI0035F4AC06